MKLDRAALERLPPDKRAKAEALLAEIQLQTQLNPIMGFHACPSDCGIPGCRVHPKQHEFMSARTRVQAAFAGNRFGKTTAIVVKSLIQHIPHDALPRRLQPFKVTEDKEGVMGRYLCPSEKAMHGFVLPALRQWCPKDLVLGNSFDKAWDKSHDTLRFKDGGQIDFFTYQQDADVLVGAARDYIAYDEPPPEGHRNECLARLIDDGGWEMFAMTPINMTGGGIGWIYRKIWKQREAEEVTVVKGSIYDNPTLSKENIDWALAQYPEEERRAREGGDFLHFGGMVYKGGFEDVLVPELTPKQLEGQDIIVGIDPGLRNAAFVWGALDSDQRIVVFDEALLQDKTPQDYFDALTRVNEKWGIKKPLYVIDPSAINRSLTNAENVEGQLARLGIYCVHGQNPVEAGVQQIRRRLEHRMLYVTKNCIGLRDEADEYRAEDRPDGEFKPVKENDHRLDALRYLCMQRPWGPEMQNPQDEPLGWVPGQAMDLSKISQRSSPPLGAMS